LVKGNLAETRVITSRLLKKVKALYGIELPLLDEKGFLDNLAACSKDLAAGCKEASSSSGDLVAQPGRAKELLESENDKSPRWASIPQPKVSVLPPTTTEGAERIMSAAELLNPAKQVCDRSTTYKEDYYLCWSCLKEERGACSMSHIIRLGRHALLLK
jgi:hypothetical protein